MRPPAQLGCETIGGVRLHGAPPRPSSARDLYDAEQAGGAAGAGGRARRWAAACPTAVADLHEGETVLDLGSGAGADVLISARRVGPSGRAIGLDMTDEMLALARANAAQAGVENAEFVKGYLEEIPLPDASVDVVISNCVINLAADKTRVLREAARVLRPGGRFAVSDVIADRGHGRGDARGHAAVDRMHRRRAHARRVRGRARRGRASSTSRSARLTACTRTPHRRSSAPAGRDDPRRAARGRGRRRRALQRRDRRAPGDVRDPPARGGRDRRLVRARAAVPGRRGRRGPRRGLRAREPLLGSLRLRGRRRARRLRRRRDARPGPWPAPARRARRRGRAPRPVQAHEPHLHHQRREPRRASRGRLRGGRRAAPPRPARRRVEGLRAGRAAARRGGRRAL